MLALDFLMYDNIFYGKIVVKLSDERCQPQAQIPNLHLYCIPIKIYVPIVIQ